MTGKQANAKSGSANGKAIHRWEWGVAALGATIVLAALIYMAWQSLTADHSPPLLSAEVTSVSFQGDHYLVLINIRNRGSATAAEVALSGELRRDGEVVEESEATVSYVPRHSTREVGLIFMGDPAKYDLRLRLKGYNRP